MPHSGFVKAFIKLFSVNPFPQMTWKTYHQFVHVAQDYQGCVLSGFRAQDHFADRLPSEQDQGDMTLLLGPRKGLLGISFPSSHPYDVITTKLQSEFPLPIKAKTCNIWVINGKHILSSKYDVYLTPPNVICNDLICIIAICSSMITSSEERSTSSVPMSCYLLIKNLFFLSNTKNILSDIEV